MNKIYEEYVDFMNDAKSIYISTIDYDTEFVYARPEISYSPCVVDNQKNAYVLVSDLTRRTSSLVQHQPVQIMFIEPENIEEIYVRKRLTFDCKTTQIERLSDKWNEQVDVFLKKFGDIIGIIKNITFAIALVANALSAVAPKRTETPTPRTTKIKMIDKP